VDPGDPRQELIPLDDTVVPSLLDTALGRLSREQPGEGRHGGGAPGLGEHLRPLRDRQHGATTVMVAPSADRPRRMATCARSRMRTAPRAPNCGQKCIPGGVPNPLE
jgi:hypothetical protein